MYQNCITGRIFWKKIINYKFIQFSICYCLVNIRSWFISINTAFLLPLTESNILFHSFSHINTYWRVLVCGFLLSKSKPWLHIGLLLKNNLSLPLTSLLFEHWCFTSYSNITQRQVSLSVESNVHVHKPKNAFDKFRTIFKSFHLHKPYLMQYLKIHAKMQQNNNCYSSMCMNTFLSFFSTPFFPLLLLTLFFCCLHPSLCRISRHQNELQQFADDVPGAGQQPWFQRGGRLQLLHVAPPGWPGLLQHPESHWLCQDDPRVQVNRPLCYFYLAFSVFSVCQALN